MKDATGDAGEPAVAVAVPTAVPAPLAASPKPEAVQQAAPAATPSDVAGWDDSSEEDEPLANRKAAKQEAKAAVEPTPRAGSRDKAVVKKEQVSQEKAAQPACKDPAVVADKKGPKAAAKAPAKPADKKQAPAAGKAAVKAEPKEAAAAAGKKQAGSTAVKREKKVFEMPGQTREAPSEADALRRFYTSLKEQNPSSEIATRWCVQHGLLPREEAEAWVLEQAQKRKAGPSPSKPAAKRKRVAGSDEENEEEDLRSTKKKPAPRKAAASKKAVPIANKAAAGKKAAPAAAARGAAKGKPKPTRDAAFVDGGLSGTDSDDDIPLLARKK